MRLIDLEPFEKHSAVLRLSYLGEDGMNHTILAPLRDIPTYGSNSPMPEYLRRALKSDGTLPDSNVKTSAIPTPFLERSIEELDISVRAHNCLMRANITTIGALVSRTEGELMHIRNMGRTSAKEVKEKLAEMGLQLAAEQNKTGDG